MSRIVKMEVYPVAGKDCMELNLSGAHAPYFTRNIVVLYDENGETGVGEVPGGEKITKALEECIPLVEGTRVAEYKSTLLKVKAHLDSKGEEDVRGNQTFDLRTGVHVITAIEAPCLDLLGKQLGVPVCELLGDGQQRDKVRMLGYLFFVGDRNKTDLPYDSEPDSDCAWYRLRHEEALTADKIVEMALATKEKYGFKDFKLKGGVLAGNEEMDVIRAMKKALPDARIDLDPNGGWLLEEAVEYVKERKQFGRPIAAFQTTQFKLADMAARIEAAQLLVYKAAMAKATQKVYSVEAAKAKLFAAETAMAVTTEVVQLFGGYGYIREYDVERMMRDAKITEIYEGTSEVQRMVISGSLLR